jgi:hypothetical protein
MPDQPAHGPDLNPDEARQAVKTGFMRRVLGVSVGLAVIALIAAWLWNDRQKPVRTPTAPAVSAAPQAPLLPRDQQRATTPATPAGPQSSQPLP